MSVLGDKPHQRRRAAATSAFGAEPGPRHLSAAGDGQPVSARRAWAMSFYRKFTQPEPRSGSISKADSISACCRLRRPWRRPLFAARCRDIGDHAEQYGGRQRRRIPEQHRTAQDALGRYRLRRRNRPAAVGRGQPLPKRATPSRDPQDCRTSDTNSLTGQIGYASPALGVVSVFGRYSDSKYINRSAPLPARRTGYAPTPRACRSSATVGTRLSFSGIGQSIRKREALSRGSVQGFSAASATPCRPAIAAISSRCRSSGSRNAAQPSTVLFVSYDIQTSLGLSSDDRDRVRA
jgi:hypothetical protein